MSDETNVPATTTATGALSTSSSETVAKPAVKKTTKPKAPPASKAEPAAKMVLRITAKPKTGFRRCGVHHPAEPIDYPADAFDATQILILKDDPSLVVEELS
ncbi:HI1506-related protein [uncultured Roseibium sp.]|uniref:HI1506-related protein n=1 Tax=uncultured Roseibium sp. TaxID=1936171 RepID=UPI0025954440|nr:HI1506-related protein [uncultured Roseibium sp.]